MTIIKILALIAAWLFFYRILKSRNKRLPKLKSLLITLLFASLIFRVSTDLYAMINRAAFSLNKQGEVSLNNSPLKVPPNQNSTYCNQFTDQNKNPLPKLSQNAAGIYCGEFWRFEKNKNLMLPYKLINNNEVLYWASPSLQIIGSRQNLERH